MKISSLTTLILTAIMGVMFSTAVRASQETDPEVLFRAAIEMEEVDGELEAAIEQYQKIIADNGNNRPIAAKAMLRLGACYEKLGQEEARRVYERLIKEYPDQSREAESARQRLALLAVSAADEKPHFRKINIPTRMSLRGSGMLSPDGQKLAFISEGSAWVVPVQGKTNSDIAGAPVRLTEPMHAWDSANVSIAWSGNGRWIGFLVAVPKTDDKAEQALYIVPAEGGEPKLAPITWQDWPGDVHTLRYALSGDAETLYFASGAGLEELRVYSISLAGGERQPLTDPITREPAISPDGSRIVFVRMEQHNPNEVHTHQVWISPIRGGSPVLVCEVAGMTWLRSPIWSPDGSMIAFLSSEGQGGNRHRQIWVVPLTGDSQPAASPSKFDLPGQTADLLAGWTQDNEIGVLLPEPRQIALYTVPSVGGKATRLTAKEAWMPSWAPDGRAIYFDGTHGGDWAAIESIPAGGGAVTRVPLSQKHEYLQPTYPTGGLAVSPDGKLLCFAGFYRRGEGDAGIFTLPISGGNPSRLIGTQPRDQEPTWSPDGRSIAFIRPEQSGSDVSIWNIFVVPSEGGMPNRISRPEDSVQMASVRIAPDGKLIAFFGRDSTLRIIPASGGSSRILVSGLGGDIRFQGISWSPDGNTIAYVSGGNLWKVSLKGGDPTRIETGLDAIISKIDWSPDGKTITFSAFKGGEHQLWLMEGFLPVVKTER